MKIDITMKPLSFFEIAQTNKNDTFLGYLQGSVPYLHILEQWIYKGVIDDPYGEFLGKEEKGANNTFEHVDDSGDAGGVGCCRCRYWIGISIVVVGCCCWLLSLLLLLLLMMIMVLIVVVVVVVGSGSSGCRGCCWWWWWWW